ncbi:MAG TPA: hypothetical protein PLT66_09485, partial [Bacillota bacterium]|nr:hypothetical protein [Bacillota bacterium]
FPEEELLDQEWTTGRIIKAIFKGFLYFCVVLVYLFFFFRFYTSCDASLVTRTYLSEQARVVYNADPNAFTMYRFDSTNINSDGTVMLRRIVYADTVDELEIGIRYVADKVTGGDLDMPFTYILRDSDGNTYEIVNRVATSRYTYGYERICFGSVDIDMSENKYLKEESEEISSADGTDLTVSEDELDEEIRRGTVYTLEVYYGEKRIESFNFYNNTTPVSQTTYK